MCSGSRQRDIIDWILLSCLLLIASAAIIIAIRAPILYQSVYSDYASSKAKADAEQEFREKCWSATTIEEMRICLENQVGTSHETRRSEENLYAQKQMAEWAMLIFWATIDVGTFTVIVTGVGIYFVRETFKAQRIATEAATEANRISRLNLVVDQRPWLNFTVRPREDLTYKEHGVSVPTKITTMNFGRSPAIGVSVRTRAIIYELDGRKTIFDQFCRDSKKDYIEKNLSHGVVFPNCEGDGSMIFNIPTEIIRQIPACPEMGGRHLFVATLFVCASYRSDLSDDIHQTGAVYMLTRVGGDGYARVIFLEDGDLGVRDIAYGENYGFSFAT